MDTTINHGKDQVVFNYIEGPVYYTFDKGAPDIDIFASTISANEPQAGNYLDLTSKTKKILINMPTSVYHFFIDFVGKILKQAEKEKNLEVVVSDHTLKNARPGGNIYADSLDLMRSLGIKVTIVDTKIYDGLKVNKVYILPNYSSEQNYESALYNAASLKYKFKNTEPFRKVFLSRKQMGNRLHLTVDLPVKHDNRIDDHDGIESYFKSLGYEIVVPEMFSNLEEQAKFFNETKILVSTTSSGLVNASFMQEGQTVVEIQTPLIVYMPKQLQMGVPVTTPFQFSDMVAVEQLHFFYLKVAFQRRHKYIAINNVDRKVSDLKATIENDYYLKNLLVGKKLEPPVVERKRRWLRR